MNGTIDDRYFEWLYSHIGSVRNRNPSRSWWGLARKLYTTRFTWFIPNDDNRIADGLELRHEFMDEYGEGITPDWEGLECSVLEMLLALARRVSFEATGTPSDWFWTFMDNMDLRMWTDKLYSPEVEQIVDQALTTLVERTYRDDGQGGLFPLKWPDQDQRNVEIWYQMSSYLLEHEYDDVRPF